MKKFLSTILLAAMMAMPAMAKKTAVDYVNVFIGTGGHGHTYPGATTPHGAVQLSPDTRTGDWDACGGYYYADSTIQGFSHNHLSGTGCADLADILFHPTTKLGSGANLYSPIGFSHANETASPGYYAVTLNNGIKAELTATTYCGIHRYTYPSTGEAALAIDMTWTLGEENIYEAMLEQTGKNEIVGMRCSAGFVDKQHIYFVAQFTSDITSFQGYNDGKACGKKAVGKAVKAGVKFAGKTVVAKVGVSTVSIENARANLKHDTADSFNFDAFRTAARNNWNKALSCINIKDSNEDSKTIFYTSLYHSLVVPNITSDANGDYRAHDNTIKRLPAGKKEYSTLSFWDTFRAWHPLITLIDTNLVSNIINSSLNIYDCNKELPIWPLSSGETGCMIGYHSAAVIAEAYAKGITDFDANKALEAMIATANTNRKGLNYYVKDGFIPQNTKRESVSCLLEYAYDDWAIAQFAKQIGRMDVYNEYIRRSQYFVNVFDGSTRFFRGKRSDGNWQTPFNPFEVGHAYTEATAWQYRFFAPHDVKGMEQLFGGREKFTAALDSIYTAESKDEIDFADITGLIGQYAHGNEPSHHISYLYSYIGQPWKTHERNLQVLSEMYTTAPDGLCGNEDCGQMSAWYIMSSLGIYPVCPAQGEYVLTTPIFKQATITLANGKKLTIKSGDYKKTPYIAKVELNGKEITKTYLTHAQLMEGGTLKFTLSSTPTDWGTAPEAAPYSYTTDKVVSIPYVDTDLYLFIDKISTTIGCATDGAEIHYTLDGSEPTEASAIFTSPIHLTETTTIRAKAFKAGYTPSATMTITATKAVFAEAIAHSSDIKPGVAYSYYEGPFLMVEDIKGTPVSTGVMPEPSIKSAASADHFGYIFEGLVDVPEDGIYTFCTISDDGSVLLINDNLVVDNNGSHGAVAATGLVALKKGLHKFTIKYFDDYEGEDFKWSWKTPSSAALEAIPANRIFHFSTNK